MGSRSTQPRRGHQTESQAWDASAPTSRGCPGGGSVKQIPAHVPRGEPERSQAADLQVREVLADAAAIGEHARHRRGDRRRSGIEGELLVDPVHQVDRGRDQRPIRGERGARELGQLRRRGGVRRRIAELRGVGVRRAALVEQLVAHRFPRCAGVGADRQTRWRSPRRRCVPPRASRRTASES